ncbi:DUF1176 domain-containing protein [Mesorhizobium sp. SB112]|uniref:DUF1176 domain-containing protein n=1 Tax=Mesorhizobium sp. SB112 TaxID=3151853 RepID=UPI00326647DC
MKAFHCGLAFATVLAASSSSFAQQTEQPYLDNRSDAAALVKSLYNAVSRQEYARAWSYFGELKPAKDVETFRKGYENTERVDVITGDVGTEGAAGSTYFSVPVSIAAAQKDGTVQVFAGCYTARLSNPQIQDENFTPLHIEKGELQPSDKPYEEALPASCGDAPVEPKDALLEKAKAMFAAAYADQCDSLSPGADPQNIQAESHDIAYRNETDEANEPERKARLFRFFCGSGAYNEMHVYYLNTDLDGLSPLQFAKPDLDIRYENEDTEGAVESVSIIGFTTEDQLINSSYDEGTRSITDNAKWRGVGDASSNGIWIFRNGVFTLVKYDVDASYDGEVNPETVLDYHTAP